MLSQTIKPATPKQGRSDLVRITEYLRPHWRTMLLAYAALIIVLVAQLLAPDLIRYIIDAGIARRDTGYIFRMGLVLVALALGRAVFAFLQGYLSEVVSQRTAYDLRNALYHKVQSLSFAYHDRAQTGELMTRATSDVDQVRDFVGSGLAQLANSALLLAATTAILVTMNARLALLTLATLIGLVVIIVRFGQRIRPMFREIQEKRGTLNTLLQENLIGVRIVRAFAREAFESERFARRNEDLLRRTVELFRLFATNLPLFMVTSSLGLLIVLWYGGMLVIRGQLTIGERVAFNTYMVLLIMPARMMGFLVGFAARASASAQRIFEILDAKADITDKPGAIELPPIKGHVCFEHVSFGYYPGAETLHDVSFEVQPGQVVALLGATGSGKTTIINLIPRFYDVTSGRVTVDGYDVRDVKVESLRRQIGSVLQETALFSGTIRENIAYGCPGADETRIVAAAKAAEAHEFIARLPDGYDTLVGERGVTLSGGQRQRIAIARALLLDPKILILDDSTSSVDVETEFQIQRALARLMAGRTSFVIAHRLSTVQNADLILVLDKGRIVAQGRHEELLQESDMYAELYELQLGRGWQEFQASREQSGRSGWDVGPLPEMRWV